jgi:hypothetical protein
MDINRLCLVAMVLLLAACGSEPDAAAESRAEAEPATSSRTGTSYTDNLAEQLDAAGKAAEELEAASRRQAEESQRAIDEAAGTR